MKNIVPAQKTPLTTCRILRVSKMVIGAPDEGLGR
jgi:hypothetical protein